MIWNIIDHRKRPYRFACVNVVIEPTCHDNNLKDADPAPDESAGFIAEAKDGGTLAEAVVWANSFDGPITLYIYDGEELPEEEEKVDGTSARNHEEPRAQSRPARRTGPAECR